MEGGKAAFIGDPEKAANLGRRGDTEAIELVEGYTTGYHFRAQDLVRILGRAIEG
jgi:hypothetical protein